MSKKLLTYKKDLTLLPNYIELLGCLFTAGTAGNGCNMRITALITLCFVFYNTLLISGGRGVFALNPEYWACHCEESTLQEGEVFNLDSPSIRASDDEEFVLNDNDICTSAYLLTGSARPTFKECKQKLPLKYLSILLQNDFALYPLVPGTVIHPAPLFAQRVESPNFIPSRGYTSLFDPPPRI